MNRIYIMTLEGGLGGGARLLSVRIGMSRSAWS